jgi:long-chain fatty acid transport protein
MHQLTPHEAKPNSALKIKSMKIKIAFILGLLALAPSSWAGNGNMLHGFGPINSSMGGAGAALWLADPIGALAFNPALIGQSEGHHISFSTEFFKDGVEITTKTDAGATGVANPSNQFGVLPSIAWTWKDPSQKMGYGFGLIAIAGFRTDYPQDDASILFASPEIGGFGRIYTDHRVTKIPTVISYDVTEKLTLGLGLNFYLAELAIAPLPYTEFDTDPVTGARYYPRGNGMDLSYAWSIQPAFHYVVNGKFSVGGSITTEQNFETFKWNSQIAAPNDPNFGQHRDLSFDLDGPMIATLGFGYKITEITEVAVDVTALRYKDVAGFGSPGGVVDGVVQPFGWKDYVMAYKIGVQHHFNDTFTARAGYNYGESPLPNKNTLTATGAPAFFKHHFTIGGSMQILKNLRADMGFYHVPRSGQTGPLLDLNGNSLGTVEESNTLTSVQIGLSWSFGG